MRLQPSVLEEPAFVSRLQIWPSLCVLLNGLQSSISDFDYEHYTKVPLPEDRDLQGFLPLEKSFECLRFANTDLEGNTTGLNKLRAMRILNVGSYLALHQIADGSLIKVTMTEKNERRFACMNENSGPSNELMKELEELSLNKERQPTMANSPVPSESASSKASSETDIPDPTMEKRVGILKPQGSLERNRDSNSINDAPGMELSQSIRKPRQNVAMQAILRRAETEQKQVTFKNVSPMIIEELEISRNQQVTPVSPITSVVPKNLQSHVLPAQNGVSLGPPPGLTRGIPIVSNSNVTQQQVGSTANPNLTQGQPPKLQLSIPQAAASHQIFANEAQNSSGTQYGIQSQNIVASCPYPNQSFNVQNPQFSKNFVTSHVSNVSPLYHVPVMACQRMSGQIMQQGIPGQTGIGAINLQQQQQQQPGMHQQQSLQNIGMHQQQQQQQQQGNGIGMHRQNLMPNNLRTNQMNMQNQMNVAGPSMVNNVPGMMPSYAKNLQQAPGIQNSTNAPMSPSHGKLNYLGIIFFLILGKLSFLLSKILILQ